MGKKKRNDRKKKPRSKKKRKNDRKKKRKNDKKKKRRKNKKSNSNNRINKNSKMMLEMMTIALETRNLKIWLLIVHLQVSPCQFLSVLLKTEISTYLKLLCRNLGTIVVTKSRMEI